ncbi:MAG: hypothetical protein K2X87_13680, partial [Gemmataceae bacterium]|nr:hypothetical protein [Gemmataceae bacterium]
AAEADRERAGTEAEARAARAKVAGRGRLTRLVARAPTDLLMALPFVLLVAKEGVDILTDYLQYAGSAVPPRFFNPLLDSLTDLLFWYTGICLALFVASFYFEKQRYRLPVTLLGLVACVVAGYWWLGQYWLNQKKTFDRSGLPLNYQRLVKLTNGWDDRRKYPTHPFADDRREAQFRLLREAQGIAAGDDGTTRGHYVLSGGLPEERSRLAVSLGCEFAFRLWLDQRRQPEEARRKVIYTTVVQALDHPDRLLDETSRSALRCVVLDDLDVTIDPPVVLLTEATKVFPELARYYGEPTRRRIERGVNVKDLPEETKAKVAAAGFVRERPKPAGGSDAARFEAPLPAAAGGDAPRPPPRPDQLDAVKQAVYSALSEKERQDEEKRLRVFQSVRAVLTKHDGGISTIWVLSNTGVRRTATDDPQRRNREKWLYLIAYLTGQTREEVERGRIELVRPADPTDPAP